MFLHRWKMSLNQDVSRCRLFFLPFYQLLFSFLFHVHIEFLYFYFFCLFTLIWRLKVLVSLVDLYLISEKSIWKNQVRRTGFLVYFELDFYCLAKINFQIDFWRLKIQFVELDFYNLISQKSSTGQQGDTVFYL